MAETNTTNVVEAEGEEAEADVEAGLSAVPSTVRI